MKVEIFTASDWTRILKENYEKIGPTDWKEVSEKISELTSYFKDCMFIEYNTSTSVHTPTEISG